MIHSLLLATVAWLVAWLVAEPLAAQHGAPADASLPPTLRTTIARPPLLPEAIASFGACRSGGFLYVYGGHIGRAHAHSRDNVVGSFRRLNLADGNSWQDLPDGPALQGTALVADNDGSVYRVGGLTARNAPGEHDDLHSTATVDRFDATTGRWQAMTPLPEARSSHDAAVLDRHLYVIGGWTLTGDEDGTWLDTAWVADLRQQPLLWSPLPPPPLARRAVAVASFAGRIVVLGGMSAGGMCNAVQVFDPATATWSTGPDLPDVAFGTAALELGGLLHATSWNGQLSSWTGDPDDGWQLVDRLATPRFFHRLAIGSDERSLLAIGGASHAGHLRTIEALPIVDRDAAPPTLHEYVLPAPGEVAYRQALAVHDGVLWAFGGNRDAAGDRFAAAQFADDVWRIELTTMTASNVARLPQPAQSLTVVPIGERGDQLLVGGLGVVDGVVQSLTGSRLWRARQRELRELPPLPAPRTQCRMVTHDGRIYLIGGIDFTPDDGGGSTGGDCSELLVCDPAAKEPRFVPSGIHLPRPRRSFGAVTLGSRLLLIGGLGDDFEHAGMVDVYDFATGSWSELPAPVAWVSPQVATIGARLFVACGGTMRGQRFTADASLFALEADGSWQRLVDELPFAVRHVQMFAAHERLWFYSANELPRGRIVLREFAPPRAQHNAVPATRSPAAGSGD